jgi:SAM-dependent methyltransferase
MPKTSEEPPSGFDRPTALPQSEAEHDAWQRDNREWWDSHPMRYDWKSDLTSDESSAEFYAEIDRRFFSNAADFMPCTKAPFDALIPFDELKSRDVLEIGIGSGSHAQLLAQRSKSYTGIDLTEYAVRSTAKRLELAGLLDARIVRMDAEKMSFDDNSFDFVWTWGVIHHSANTERVLAEMHRVLRPGGTATIMVYHRSWWHYYVMIGLVRGIVLGGLLKSRSLHKTAQQYTDGALARYYTAAEWGAMVRRWFVLDHIMVFGSKAELIPLPGGRVKERLLRLIPNGIGRFLTNRLRFGSFLVSTVTKA